MQPFVLLSMNRSGSYHLAALLNQHPDIICNGEILNATSQDYWRDNPEPQVIGIKIIDHQLYAFPQILPLLLSCPRMHFLILQRRNQFEALRSIAQVPVAHWQRPTGDHPLGRTVHLDIAACWERIVTSERFHADMRDRLPSERTSWIFYEDLVENQEKVLGQLWPFLGVSPPGGLVESPLQRLESRPLSVTVCNFSELQKAFADTVYANWLNVEFEQEPELELEH